MTIVLSLVVPSATARRRGGAIMMGVIAAFGVDKRSNIAAGIMIIVAQATSIWASASDRRRAEPADGRLHGKDAGPARGLVRLADRRRPWSLIMSAVLVVVVLKMLPPESNSIAGGKPSRSRCVSSAP